MKPCAPRPGRGEAGGNSRTADALVNAWALALLSLKPGGASIADGILLGILVWVGFQATLKTAQVVFE